MNDVEEKISAIYRKTASELSLEVGKTLKLESNHQIGYYMRLTKKVRDNFSSINDYKY
jgi:DNA mismatch repair protein MSH2